MVKYAKIIAMNESLLNDLLDLRNKVLNSEEYKNLIIKNELIEKSDDVKILSYKKDMAILKYEDALKHYSKNSLEVLNEEKNMAKAIYNLNNNELVKEYNKAFEKFSAIYDEINLELFSFYKMEKKND